MLVREVGGTLDLLGSPPLDGSPPRPGFARDESPAAVGRGRPNGDKRGPCARDQPGRLDGRRGVCPQHGEPLAWLIARREAARVLRRDPLSIRVLLTEA